MTYAVDNGTLMGTKEHVVPGMEIEEHWFGQASHTVKFALFHSNSFLVDCVFLNSLIFSLSIEFILGWRLQIFYTCFLYWTNFNQSKGVINFYQSQDS